MTNNFELYETLKYLKTCKGVDFELTEQIFQTKVRRFAHAFNETLKKYILNLIAI